MNCGGSGNFTLRSKSVYLLSVSRQTIDRFVTSLPCFGRTRYLHTVKVIKRVINKITCVFIQATSFGIDSDHHKAKDGLWKACKSCNIQNIYAFIQFQLDALYALFLSWKIFSSKCFGCYLHPSSGAQLHCTAIGFYGFDVFIPLEQVLVFGHFNTLARSVTDSVPV
jgi:hypothetical protein